MSAARRLRRLILTATAAVALVFAGTVAGPAVATPEPPPASMAALGDSISQALDSCGYRNCPTYSWSTGTVSSVNSHASRIRAKGVPGLVVYNDSVSGVKAAGLLAQAQQAVLQQPAYVTLQIGANDACTSTVAGMTPTGLFQTQVAAAFTELQKLPNTRIFVASIPNLKQLWNVSKAKSSARLVWAAARICQSMLVRPTSTATADVQRRDTVQLQVDAYNGVLAAACAAYGPRCTWDGGTIANFAFTSSHISILDYFHPSISGQAKLAELTWPLTPYGRP
ncbi:SGNH/GDSL hydrolase family protein [Agromyces sp. MMS24-JH15]|uniref:SGNH/GDSL hydrolase family protein n=1 Tax=Agromyces sp. MMS24-JH15 TaxID=3243765 RepID=UPI0037488ACD